MCLCLPLPPEAEATVAPFLAAALLLVDLGNVGGLRGAVGGVRILK